MPREDDSFVRAIDMCAHMHIDTAMVEGIHLVAAEWLLCARTKESCCGSKADVNPSTTMLSPYTVMAPGSYGPR